jgi:hypothetical protein
MILTFKLFSLRTCSMSFGDRGIKSYFISVNSEKFVSFWVSYSPLIFCGVMDLFRFYIVGTSSVEFDEINYVLKFYYKKKCSLNHFYLLDFI